MLFVLLFAIPFSVAVKNEETSNVRKPYVVLPVPLELPNRNDRSEQCWLRIEDVELTETLTIYCHLAQAFLQYFIYEYNTRKMTEDKVDVSLWSEDPRPREDVPLPKADGTIAKKDSNQNTFIDWKLTTIMDPTTNRRLYVSKKADCRLIMYSREGMTNYKVDCDKFLYFINVRMNSSAVCKGNVKIFMTALFIPLVVIIKPYFII